MARHGLDYLQLAVVILGHFTVLNGKCVLLVISGGIAAFKSLELIRRLRERGVTVRCVLTAAGAEFVTALSVSALAGEKAYTGLFSLTEETEMGHIRLGREADLIVVAPATADFMARCAAGIADDLATATLLVASMSVLMAPAMNVEMWAHAATRRNVAQLKADGVRMVGPDAGDLACGEVGAGRMAEPADIVAAIEAVLNGSGRPLRGRRALVTSGPTREPIDPVRYLSNRSSGKQGHAIAGALARLGARTTLVSGPSAEPEPPGVRAVHIETAAQMLEACTAELPVDVAVCAAAVADWRTAESPAHKLKKGANAPHLTLIENADVLASLGRAAERPTLLIGFAAETEDLIERARQKRVAKGCDWILANDVAPGSAAFEGDVNTVHLITADATESWPTMDKTAVAARLAARIATALPERAS